MQRRHREIKVHLNNFQTSNVLQFHTCAQWKLRIARSVVAIAEPLFEHFHYRRSDNRYYILLVFAELGLSHETD